MFLIQSIIAFLGRALLSLIFIAAAINKIANWQESLSGFVDILNNALILYVDNPLIQNILNWSLVNVGFLFAVATIFELIGGLSVFLGIWTRVGAFLLFCVLIPATLLAHAFWNMDGIDYQKQLTHFMKNLGIMGGLLIVIAVGKVRRKILVHDKVE